MVDASRIQDRIYYGYAASAAKLGSSNQQYRPVNTLAPISSALATLPAIFNATDMTFGRAAKYGDPYRFGLFDGRLTQAGDYLIDGTGKTHFIASQGYDAPMLCIECNSLLTFARMPNQSVPGAAPYGGEVDAQQENYAAGWPASVLLGGVGAHAVDLPAATRNEGYRVLLPPSFTAQLQPGDMIFDAIGNRYALSSAEITDKGPRLSVVMVDD